MIKAIIVDDEQHCIDRLAGLVKKEAGIKMIGTALTVEAGVRLVNSLHPDLLFLDIQIGEKSGFDLLQKVSSRDFEIIFTTAYENYAIQAIKCSAIDYLLKPIDQIDLQEALKKLEEEFFRKITAGKLEVLLHNIQARDAMSKKIILPTTTGFEFLEVADIIRCESNINYTTLFMKDQKKFLVAKTLKDIQGMLGETQFFRVHNSHLVNLDYIQSYHKGKGGSVILNDGSEIMVSTRRKDDFLKRLADL